MWNGRIGMRVLWSTFRSLSFFSFSVHDIELSRRCTTTKRNDLDHLLFCKKANICSSNKHKKYFKNFFYCCRRERQRKSKSTMRI